jgi:hypothetical protein
MTPDPEQILARLNELHPPFWKDIGYWISLIVGVVGLVYSYLAFKEAGKAFHEAKSAKEAATAASRTVKIQTITIELSEIVLKLDRIEPDLPYNEARDLLSETQRRLRRLMAPFAKDPELKDTIATVLHALTTAQTELKAVRPTDEKAETPFSVYYGTQDAFDTIRNSVADLLGMFEKQTLDFGDGNARAR